MVGRERNERTEVGEIQERGCKKVYVCVERECEKEKKQWDGERVRNRSGEKRTNKKLRRTK